MVPDMSNMSVTCPSHVRHMLETGVFHSCGLPGLGIWVKAMAKRQNLEESDNIEVDIKGDKTSGKEYFVFSPTGEVQAREQRHNYPQVKLKRLNSDKLVKSYKITKKATKRGRVPATVAASHHS